MASVSGGDRATPVDIESNSVEGQSKSPETW